MKGESKEYKVSELKEERNFDLSLIAEYLKKEYPETEVDDHSPENPAKVGYLPTFTEVRKYIKRREDEKNRADGETQQGPALNGVIDENTEDNASENGKYINLQSEAGIFKMKQRRLFALLYPKKETFF